MSIEHDPTEDFRRDMVAKINTSPRTAERAKLEADYGPGDVWDTAEMSATFEVLSFMAPYVIVIRRSDGVKGTLCFRHSPRHYFDFRAD